MSKYSSVNIGSFKALVAEKSSKSLFNVVLFHGYGGNALNLYPLSRYLDVDDRIKWIFPEGPQPADMDPSGLGRTWFPVDVEAFLQDKDNYNVPPHIFDSAIDSVYQALKPLPNLIIGGFSQGAVLTTNLIMKTDLHVKGLIVLSGALLDKKRWHKHTIREGLPFFQSHGYSDAMIKHSRGQKLEATLREYGLIGKLFSFEGGHEISESVLVQLQKFLTSLILNHS